MTSYNNSEHAPDAQRVIHSKPVSESDLKSAEEL